MYFARYYLSCFQACFQVFFAGVLLFNSQNALAKPNPCLDLFVEADRILNLELELDAFLAHRMERAGLDRQEALSAWQGRVIPVESVQKWSELRVTENIVSLKNDSPYFHLLVDESKSQSLVTRPVAGYLNELGERSHQLALNYLGVRDLPREQAEKRWLVLSYDAEWTVAQWRAVRSIKDESEPRREGRTAVEFLPHQMGFRARISFQSLFDKGHEFLDAFIDVLVEDENLGKIRFVYELDQSGRPIIEIILLPKYFRSQLNRPF